MNVWRPPEIEVVKFNIGSRWSNKERIAGAAWVLRDSRREVMLHSHVRLEQWNQKMKPTS